MNTHQHTVDTYWTHNTILGEGNIHGEQTLIRLKVHRSDERYYDKRDELFQLSSRSGDRIYFHAKPYILIPDMTITFGLSQTPRDDGALGKVLNTDVTKLKPLDISMAQAWYYPAEKALVLWECFLEEPYRQPDILHDQLQTTVWTNFERVLLEQLPETRRIYTTYEPIYEVPVYEQFLAAQGFTQCGRVAFVKEVRQPVQEATSV